MCLTLGNGMRCWVKEFQGETLSLDLYAADGKLIDALVCDEDSLWTVLEGWGKMWGFR